MIEIGIMLAVLGLGLSYFHAKRDCPKDPGRKIVYEIYDEVLSCMVFAGALLIIIDFLIKITSA